MKPAEYICYDGLGLAELIRNKEVSGEEVLACSLHTAPGACVGRAPVSDLLTADPPFQDGGSVSNRTGLLNEEGRDNEFTKNCHIEKKNLTGNQYHHRDIP